MTSSARREAFRRHLNWRPGASKAGGASQDIGEGLQMILATTIGEKVMQPTFGCNLADHSNLLNFGYHEFRRLQLCDTNYDVEVSF